MSNFHLLMDALLTNGLLTTYKDESDPGTKYRIIECVSMIFTYVGSQDDSASPQDYESRLQLVDQYLHIFLTELKSNHEFYSSKTTNRAQMDILLKAWVRMTNKLKTRLQSYLPFFVKDMIRLADTNPTVFVGDDRTPLPGMETTFVNQNHQRTAVHIDVESMQLKSLAVALLGEMFEQNGQYMIPFLEKVALCMVPALSYSMMQEVRQHAAMTIPAILRAALTNAMTVKQSQKPAIFVKYATFMFQELKQTCCKSLINALENETDEEVKNSFADNLAESIKVGNKKIDVSFSKEDRQLYAQQLLDYVSNNLSQSVATLVDIYDQYAREQANEPAQAMDLDQAEDEDADGDSKTKFGVEDDIWVSCNDIIAAGLEVMLEEIRPTFETTIWPYYRDAFQLKQSLTVYYYTSIYTYTCRQ